jgi:hypothetical protein
MHCPSSCRISEMYALGVLFFILTIVRMASLYAWRDRIPYAVEMLRTVAQFIDTYPGPTRVGASPTLGHHFGLHRPH